MSSPSRLAVLLFTDIVGSTDLKSRLGMTEYARALEAHNALFERICRESNGQILKHTGDGFLAEFKTPSDAVRAALRFQAEMKGQVTAARVGVHVGEVAAVEMAGRPDVVGVAADLAARVMSLADGGRVLLTRFPFNDARQFVNDAALRWVAHGPYLFKGFEEPVEIFEVGRDGQSPFAAPENREKARRVVPHDQEPTLGWRPAIALAIPSRQGWMLDRKLGEGGFGEVWLGRHDRTKQTRVFKFCFDAERLRSFKRELTFFRLLRDALGDRHDIAKLYEVKLDEPPFFLESEWTEGGNLIEWAESRGEIEKVPFETRLRIVANVADAVAAAHSVGILHKDIKPANVLIHVDPDGTVHPRLADFGIGMLADRKALDERHITATGFTQITEASSPSSYTAGTRLYAPPEVLAGKPFTIQGDIYALGVLLYQMVVADLHRPLAEGWQREVQDELLHDDIAACVEGDPSRRLQSAAELARRLRSLEKRQEERREAQRLAARALRRRRIARASVAAALLLAVLLALSARNLFRERRLRALAETERHRAERNLAHSLVEQANSLELLSSPSRARPLYDEAWDSFTRLGASPLAAQLGLFDSHERNPPPLIELFGHTDGILCLDVSKDGALALTGAKDGTLKLWELRTGRVLHTLVGHDHWVIGCALSPDAKLALSAGDDKEHQVRLWDLTSGKQIRALDGHTAPGRAVAFSSDGKTAVSGAQDNTVRTWDIPSGQAKHVLQHPAAVRAVAVSPDGNQIAGGIDANANVAMVVWDAASGQQVRAFGGHSARSLSFHPDGRRIVSATYNYRLSVWDLKTGEEQVLPFGADIAVAVSPDGWQLLTGRQDGGVAVVDLDKALQFAATRPANENEKFEVRPLYGMSDSVRDIAWSSDRRFVLAAGLDKSLRVWMVRDRPVVTRDFVEAADFSPDGNMIISAIWRPNQRRWLEVELYDRATLLPLSQLDVPLIQLGFPRLFEGRFATWGMSDAVVVVDLLSGNVLHRIPYLSSWRDIRPVAYSPARGLVAVVAWPSTGEITVWDGRAQALVHTLKGHEVEPKFTFNHDGTLLASGSADNTVRLWDLSSGAQRGRADFTAGLTALQFSPDGRALMVGDQVGRMNLLEVPTLREIRRFTGHGFGVSEVCFSPDGTLGASRDGEWNVRIWDVATARSLHAFANGGTPRFSPDGRALLLHSPSGLQVLEFDRPARYREFQRRLPAARAALQSNPNDSAALRLLGEYYAFRGVHDWAAEFLERARTAGADVSPLMLARCYWKIGQREQAEREFRAAKSRGEAPAEYLDLCIKAMQSAAPTTQRSD